MTTDLIERVQQLDLTKTINFNAVFLGPPLSDLCTLPFADVHRDMFDILDSDYKQLAIAFARNGGKSINASVGYTLKEICTNHEIKRVFLGSNEEGLSTKWLRYITNELLHNKGIRKSFGGQKGEIWQSDERHWVFPDGRIVEIISKGWKGSFRGNHPQLIIIDDLEDEQGVISPTVREHQSDWLFGAVIPSADPGAKIILIGSPLHPEAILETCLKSDNWHSVRFPAVTPMGKSYWPERWSMDALMKIKKTLIEDGNEKRWWAEYMCQPIATENPIFRRQWFRPFDPFSDDFQKKVAKGLYTVLWCDPAISRNETADFTSIGALSATFDEPLEIYCRPEAMIRDRMPLNETARKLIDIYDRVNANVLVIETVAYQQALADEVRRLREVEHKYINVVEVKPDKDKERRANAVQPLFVRGNCFFDVNDKMTQILIEEACLFPTGSHDDTVDGMVMGLGHIKGWHERAGIEKQTAPVIVRPGNAQPRSHTGVI